MDGDKITLDRDTFKALAVDTRVKILRILDERQHTLSDLAEELEMAPSTIKEHLDVLVAAGLIQQIDKGMKWKYYRLTSKGKEIINPYEKKVLIILATTLLMAFAFAYDLFNKLQNLLPTQVPIQGVSENMAAATRAGGEALRNEAPMLLKSEAQQTVNETIQAGYEAADASLNAVTQSVPQIPYFEIAMLVVCAVIVGICIGFLIRKKKAI